MKPTFGEFMKKARGNGISLYKLARMTGISDQQLVNIETGKCQPTLPKAELICKALGVKYVIGE